MEAFEKFTKTVKFKQQRVLFFYADPFLDTPVDEVTTIQEFFKVKFEQKEDLPALMLVNTADEIVEFLQPIETISADSIADMIMSHVFSDLLMTIPAVKYVKSNNRGIPETKERPADLNSFGGIFNEL